MIAVIAAVLMFAPPPNIPLSPAAEVCILKAELCMESQPAPMGPDCDDEVSTCTCIEGYESCAQGIPDLFEPTCRVSYVWCIIEPPNPKSETFEASVKACAEVFDLCPTFPW